MIFEVDLKQSQNHHAAWFYGNADGLTDCLAERTTGFPALSAQVFPWPHSASSRGGQIEDRCRLMRRRGLDDNRRRHFSPCCLLFEPAVCSCRVIWSLAVHNTWLSLDDTLLYAHATHVTRPSGSIHWKHELIKRIGCTDKEGLAGVIEIWTNVKLYELPRRCVDAVM